MDVVGKARENPDRGAVFVHDHLGADRAGCMVAVYRVLADKYPFDRAHSEMLQNGFHDGYSKLRLAIQKLDPNATTSSPGSAPKPAAHVRRKASSGKTSRKTQ